MKINYDIDGETSLLGTCLVMEDKLYLACQALTHEAFYLSENREIFRIIEKLYEEGSAVNLETLVSRASIDGTLDVIKGELPKLLPMAMGGNFSANLRNIIHNKYKGNIAHFVRKLSEDFDTTSIEKIQLLCDEYQNNASSIPTYTAKDLFDGPFYDTKNVQTWLDERRLDNQEGRLIQGLPTGFGILDSYINGLYKPAYVIVAGIPGSGKSTFALQMLKYIVQTGHKAAFITLEMMREQASLKLLSIESGIPYQNLSKGNTTDEERKRLLHVIAKLKLNTHLFLQDMQIQNLSSLRARIKRLVEVDGAEIVFIDYLSLIENPIPGVNMHEKILQISSCIRSLLKELKVPGVILCQLNRASNDKDEIPKAHHLFGSSQIEKDASEILMLHPMNDGTDQRRLYIRKSRYGIRDLKILYSFENGIFEELR